MTTTYVFIDTNIFVRYLSQGRQGCEPQHWKQIVSELQTGAIKIVLPEIVKLELEKKTREIPRKIEAAHITIRNQLQQTLESQIKSTETEDMRLSLLSHYDSLHETKLKGIHERYEYLQSELSHPNVLEIPLSVDIFLAARRRNLSGRLAPTSEGPSDADCGIIESLASHFATTQEKNVRLLFCSDNTKDFAIQLEDKSWALHSLIRSALPDGLYFRNLKDLSAWLTSRTPAEPPKTEDLKAAELHQEKTRIKRIAKKQLEEAEDSHTRWSRLLNELNMIEVMLMQEHEHQAVLRAQLESVLDTINRTVDDNPHSHAEISDLYRQLEHIDEEMLTVKDRLALLHDRRWKLKQTHRHFL